MSNINFLPIPVTKKIFNKATVIYNPADIWKIIKDLSNGIDLDSTRTATLFDCFLSIGILVLKQKYPGDPVVYKDGEFIKNAHQVDELMEIIAKLFEYYTEDTSRILRPDYFPSVPESEKDRRRFHSHLKNKAGNILIDVKRKEKNDPLKRRLAEGNDSFGEGYEADSRRSAVYTDAMTGSPSILEMESPNGFELNLQKICVSNDIYEIVLEKATNKIMDIYATECLKNLLPKLSEAQFESVLTPAIMQVDESSTSQKRDSFDWIMKSEGNPFISDTNTGDEKRRSGVFYKFKQKSIDEKTIIQIKAYANNENLNNVHFITDMNKTDVENSLLNYKEKLENINIEVLDLLDMAKFIASSYRSLGEAEQGRLKSLIEELVSDF